MMVSKKEGRVLDDAIKNWLDTDVISKAESEKLKSAYTVSSFDWKQITAYSFWLAISCIVMSILFMLMDQWLFNLLKKLSDAPDSIKCIILTTLSASLYALGMRRKKQQPDNIYSNEAILFLGIVTTAIAILFLGRAVTTGTGHFSTLLLLAALIYAFLGLWLPTKLVWLFSLLSFGSWFGTETGAASNWGAYYLGMNYPLRFAIFGLIVTLSGSYLFTQWQNRGEFLQPTRALGLFFLLTSLWLLSIFGNYGDLEHWHSIKQIELIHWSIIFAVAALTALYHGMKYNDGITRDFGLIFILINLYTRFFEYFWHDTHKAIFFAILAFSFWFLGAKAEKIWQLRRIKN